MNNLGLPLPEKIMEALQINTGAPESASGSTSPTSSSFSLPTYSQLNSVRQVDPVGVLDVLKQYTNNLDSSSPSSSLTLVSPVPPIIDVREPQEFTSDTLPGIPGSLNIPLSRLASALASSKSNSTPYTIPPQFRSCPTLVLVCRAGVRSATAASVLSAYGYDNVVNLKGGLLTMKDELVKMKKR